MISKKLAKWIAYHPKTVLIVCLILIIPSIIGYFLTGVNYDILSYLPENLESVQGEQILDETFHNSASSFIIVKDTEPKDIQKLEDQIRQVEGVSNVIGATDIADVTIPKEILPEVLTNVFYSQDGSSTLIMVQYKNSGSSQVTMDAIASIRKIMNKNMLLSGLSAITVDTKDLTNSQAPLYVVIAIALALIALSFTMTSWVLPFVLLAALGTAVIYNMGTNIIFGEISFITKSIAAILQLGVTVDYSVFLMDRFEEEKKHHDTKKDAMAAAIDSTFLSLMGSSLTTVFGFLALCFMSFTLGKDMGLVMAKGVIIGVICCVTLLPAIILIFDPLIEKTKHKPLIKNTNRLSGFIIRHYKIWLAVFCIGLLPAVYGNNHTKIYYNIDKSLPSTLDSNVANKKLEDTFDMSTMHIIMMDKNISNANRTTLMKDIEKVDGVKWAFGLNSVFGANVPASMIPKDVKDMLQSDEQELVFVCSKYSSATDESNSQIAAINDLVKKYDSNGMVIGEAPLMKDLQDVTDIDLVNVNVASVAAIFIIIMLVFKSISVPIILVAVIEFAINVNMAIPFFQGIELPFVASIVVGTIQLGATVDYAILMTSRYQKERRKGFGKKEAVMNAHKACALSIMTSGFSFFAATFGVAWYSKVDMIGAICTLLSRGALISMACVIFILPAMFIIFDKVICKTSIDFLGEKAKAKAAAKA